MQTPPPTPPRTPKRPLETPKSMGGNSPGRGSTSRVLFTDETPTKRTCNGDQSSEDGVPGTPPSGRFSLKGLLSPGRGEFPGIPSGPPPALYKSKLSRNLDSEEPTSLALEGLVLLEVPLKSIDYLGTGSFGTVDKVVFLSPPGTPCSPPVAMKTVRQSERQGPKALRAEAANLGLEGCASGVAATNNDGDLIIFTSVATPLSHIRKIGLDFLEEVIRLMKSAVFLAPLRVILDLKLENLGFIPEGTATVVPDEKGQPSIGPLTKEKKVVILDLGNFLDAEDTDATYGVFLEEKDLMTVEQQANFCNFKFEVMEALLRNQFADMPEDKKWIVARICDKYGWRYAGGQQYQPDFQE
jgi:hypothetical protein